MQQFFNFFSGSTSRWEILTKHVTLTLKKHADTRWASKYNAIHPLFTQLDGVLAALKEISINIKFRDAVSVAKNLIQQINFTFIIYLTIWDQILNHIFRVNLILQQSNISISSAAKCISGLKDVFQNMRNEGIDKIIENAKEICNRNKIDANFKECRQRKRKRMHDEIENEEEQTFSQKQLLQMELFKILDSILSSIYWRFKTLYDMANYFQFLTGEELVNMSLDDIKKHATDLALHYSSDIDVTDFINEIESFKNIIQKLVPNIMSASPLDILNGILKRLRPSYPNIETAYKIFLSLPISVASCERGFSKLKIIKSYNRSTMGQERLSGLSILSIEHEIAKSINFDDIINEFALAKARRIKF